uniref:Uncharacterized protein n=2 Tax=Salmonella enterica TaxID=28901 RepID=I7D0H9_SALER|nr:hypothetical protein SESS1296_03602 [Salmonella enterica subsp. salamae serovar Sofia]
MRKQYFIFLLKGKTVTPQSLEEPCAEKVICEMLRQQFYLSRIHIFAATSQEALEKFQKLTQYYTSDLSPEVILC